MKYSNLRNQVLAYNRTIEFTLVNETVLFAWPGKIKRENESVKYSNQRYQVMAYNRTIEFTLVNETILFAWPGQIKCEDESVKYLNLRNQVLAYNWTIEFTLVNKKILFAWDIRRLEQSSSTNDTSDPGQMKCEVESVKWSNYLFDAIQLLFWMRSSRLDVLLLFSVAWLLVHTSR